MRGYPSHTILKLKYEVKNWVLITSNFFHMIEDSYNSEGKKGGEGGEIVALIAQIVNSYIF